MEAWSYILSYHTGTCNERPAVYCVCGKIAQFKFYTAVASFSVRSRVIHTCYMFHRQGKHVENRPPILSQRYAQILDGLEDRPATQPRTGASGELSNDGVCMHYTMSGLVYVAPHSHAQNQMSQFAHIVYISYTNKPESAIGGESRSVPPPHKQKYEQAVTHKNSRTRTFCDLQTCFRLVNA